MSTDRSASPLQASTAAALLVLLLTLPWSPTARALGGGEGEPEAPTGELSAEIDQQADTALATTLERRFDQIDGLAAITAEAVAGVVTLGGEVLSEAQRDEAIALARRVEGVAQVVDEIQVVVDPRQRLAPAFDEAVERLQSLISYLPLLAIGLLVVVFFWLLGRWITSWDRLFGRFGRNRFSRDLLRQAVRAGLLVTGILVALDLLDATALVGAVLGTAGVIGLALGFAFRDLVENYISSVLLSLRQPFAPNDHVLIDGHEGKVVRLTSRATILMTLDGNHLRIPNSQVFKSVLLNYSRNPKRRFEVGIGVGVEEDLVEAQRLGVEALDGLEGVEQDPAPMAIIEELGDSSVVVRFYGWVDQRAASYAKVKGEAIRHLKSTLEEAGMDLPEPIYRVHMIATEKRAAAAKAPPAAAPPQEHQPDISPEEEIDRQIASDRRGDDEDLLSPEAPSEL